MAISRQFVREGAHIARALYVVLSPQRVDADAVPTDMTRGHREVRDAHDHRAALTVFCDAEAVVDRCVPRACVKTRRAADFFRWDTREALRRLGRMVGTCDEFAPPIERCRITPLVDER